MHALPGRVVKRTGAQASRSVGARDENQSASLPDLRKGLQRSANAARTRTHARNDAFRSLSALWQTFEQPGSAARACEDGAREGEFPAHVRGLRPKFPLSAHADHPRRNGPSQRSPARLPGRKIQEFFKCKHRNIYRKYLLHLSENSCIRPTVPRVPIYYYTEVGQRDISHL